MPNGFDPYTGEPLSPEEQAAFDRLQAAQTYGFQVPGGAFIPQPEWPELTRATTPTDAVGQIRSGIRAAFPPASDMSRFSPAERDLIASEQTPEARRRAIGEASGYVMGGLGASGMRVIPTLASLAGAAGGAAVAERTLPEDMPYREAAVAAASIPGLVLGHKLGTRISPATPPSAVTAPAESLPVTQPSEPSALIVQKIAGAKPLQEQNAEALHRFRIQQAQGASGFSGSEESLNEAMAAMRGASERATMEPIGPQLAPEQRQSLFQKVADTYSRPSERLTGVNTAQVLREMIDDGRVPTKSEIPHLEKSFPGITSALENAGVIASPNGSIWENIVDFGGASRTMRTVWDQSAAGRQMFKFAPTHPRAFAQGVATQWKLMFGSRDINVTRENARLVQDAIELDPLRSVSVRAKLDILNPESLDRATQEEMFSHGATKVARFLRDVPGVERSEISYTVGLNKFRMETFKDIVSRFSPEELASMPDSELEAVGAFVNAMTGRGRIPAFAQDHATTLTTVFFSPRNVMGNIQSHGALFAKNPIVRREAWKSLAGFYATGAGLLATAKLAGFDVGIDPNASDFGKIIMPGGTRVDIWGGNQQYYRLASNLLQQGVTSSTGKFSAKSRASMLADFIRQKLAPVPGWAANQVDPFPSKEPRTAATAAKEFAQLYIPLVANDMYDSFKAEYPALALGASAASFFGFGTTVNKSDVLRAQLDRNEYNSFTPQQQIDSLGEQSWKDLRGSGAIPDRYKQEILGYESQSDWRAATLDAYEQLNISKGVPSELARAIAGRQLAQNPIQKKFSDVRNAYERQWVLTNPVLALQIMGEDATRPPDERRLSLDMKEIALLIRKANETQK